MEAIFISYRRSDTEGQAGRLFQNLADAFGRGAVLLDVAGLEKGLDFRRSIERRLEACKVMLVLIGPAWVAAKAGDGTRRLDDPGDFVRIEIAAALRRDIPVVPVLVAGATMPAASALPDGLKDLVFRDGVELTHARWDSDVRLLVDAVRPYLGAEGSASADTSPPSGPAQAGSQTAAASQPRPASRLTVAVPGLLAVLAALAFGGWYADQRQPGGHAAQPPVGALQPPPAAVPAPSPSPQQATQLLPAAAPSGSAVASGLGLPVSGLAAPSGLAAASAPAAPSTLAAASAGRPAAGAAADRVPAAPSAERPAAAGAGTAAAPAPLAPAADAPGAGAVTGLRLIADSADGADVGIQYRLAEPAPATVSLRLCLKQGDRRVQGTTCMVRPAPDGEKRVMMGLRFADRTAASLKGRGQARLEACLLAPSEPGRHPRADPPAARCRMLDW